MAEAYIIGIMMMSFLAVWMPLVRLREILHGQLGSSLDMI